MIDNKRTFPQDFTSTRGVVAEFTDHSVAFTISEIDNGWLWIITINYADNRRITGQIYQHWYDSAKWSFYEKYSNMCRHIGINPAEMN